MRALVLHGVGDLRMEEVPTPEAGPGMVRVRIAACGVCGSDIPRIFVKGTYHFPTIPGHEFAGTVDALGEGVDDLVEGDPVAVFPLLWCGKCAACEVGAYVQCSNYGYLGSRDDGGFAEYVVAPRANLIKLPPGVELSDAAMTEPASVALHALRRTDRNLFGCRIAIFGAGPIGLMVAQWARAMGAGKILLFDIAEPKLALARGLGFVDAFDSRSVDPLKQLAAEGCHVCVESAGVPETMRQACATVARNGKVVLLGNPSSSVDLPSDLISQLMRREASLLGTWNSTFAQHGTDDDWHTTLAALASGSLRLAPLVSHHVSFDDAVDILHEMRNNPGVFSKVLIHT